LTDLVAGIVMVVRTDRLRIQEDSRRANFHLLAQTHRPYYASPRADISRDGHLVAFTSNWGVEGGRKDVFILKIP
jgi:hypothetical protein